jgi:transcriptional regulator with XRE-family HTH domain
VRRVFRGMMIGELYAGAAFLSSIIFGFLCQPCIPLSGLRLAFASALFTVVLERIVMAEWGPSAGELLRRNVLELMRSRGLNQTALATKLGHSQPWLSRRLSGKGGHGGRFQFEDVDRLANVFGLSPAQLLCAGQGEWDRRKQDRRSGEERRAMPPIIPRDHKIAP